MNPDPVAGSVGPGHGPDGSPLAIAMNPVLTGMRPSESMRRRVAEAAPGSRLVEVSSDGTAQDALDDVEVMLRGWALGGDALDRVVSRAPRLRWIHSISVGVESVLTPIVLARGLTVTNGRGVFSRPIAEYVLTMMLSVCRRLPQLLELQAERTWQPLEAREMAETTIGLVGLGSIGCEVAELAAPLGPQIVAVRRQPKAAEVPGVRVLGDLAALPELLASSDFVVLAVPLTAETDSLIGAAALAACKPGAWLINVARGALVDELALARALEAGPLGGAILDTVREEPLPPTSPLYQLPNCIVTPHTSWSSAAVVDRSVELFCDNLRRYRTGQALRFVVDQRAGY
jgi:phosphoglycerate dehydrogenase-like enzyme